MDNKQKLILAAATAGAGLAVRELLRRRGEPSLRGNVVLITGGSKGLGLAMARRFAHEGCRIVICARNEQELIEARADLRQYGAEALVLTCDVSDKAAVDAMVAEARSRMGRIDILVNNAGQISVGPLRSMTVEDFDNAMRVMFWGTVYPTLAVLPEFFERKQGRVVTITSFGGKVSVPHLVPYTCAKFAATGFSEGLRAELAADNIQVTTVAPGLLRTGSFLNALFKGDRNAEAAWFSLGASTPGLAMSADTAARKIVTATKRGEAELVLTTPAKLLSNLHGVFPGFTADLLGLIASIALPRAHARNQPAAGRTLSILQSPWMRVLTTFGRIAAKRYNQTHGLAR